MTPSTELLEEPPPKRRAGGGGPPVGGNGGDGGDGGGGGEGDGDRSPDDARPPRGSLADLGVRLALVGITSLFLVFFAAYVNLRRAADLWPPPDAPGAPLGLWASTFLLAASSWTMVRAQSRTRSARPWLLATLLLGGAFLAAQVSIWVHLGRRGLLPSTNGYGTVFYALTGLHALHVTVGLAYMTLLAARRSDAARAPEKLRLAALYWHFMGILWLILFSLLWIPDGART